MYTSREKIEEYLGETVSKTDEQLNAYIKAVDSQIDAYVNRYKLYSDEVETRIYRGGNSYSLQVDMLRNDTPATISVEGIPVTDFSYDSEGRFRDGLSRISFERGFLWDTEVSVTGKFGILNELPADVELSATMLVVELLNSFSNSQDVKAETIGKYRVEYATTSSDSSIAFSLLDKYKAII